MSWESRKGNGRYYTRSRRVNGRIVREYYGNGIGAEIAHTLDKADQAKREAEAQVLHQRKQRDNQTNEAVHAFENLADVIGRGMMIVAGFHQHKRGSWRKRNAKFENGNQEQDDRPLGDATASQ